MVSSSRCSNAQGPEVRSPGISVDSPVSTDCFQGFINFQTRYSGSIHLDAKKHIQNKEGQWAMVTGVVGPAALVGASSFLWSQQLQELLCPWQCPVKEGACRAGGENVCGHLDPECPFHWLGCDFGKTLLNFSISLFTSFYHYIS